jgi:hypothetical protein
MGGPLSGGILIKNDLIRMPGQNLSLQWAKSTDHARRAGESPRRVRYDDIGFAGQQAWRRVVAAISSSALSNPTIPVPPDRRLPLRGLAGRELYRLNPAGSSL